MCTALTLSGCGKSNDAGKRDQAVEVGFVTVQRTSVPLVSEASGRVAAFQQSEVRPQISGIVRRRAFQEGGYVQAGQTLYQIDPSLYRAAADEARANLVSAAASADAARTKADRLKPLAAAEAVARQDYTDAAASARVANAGVAQNRARLVTAQVNLGFTRVPAPISGRIGRSLVTEGALVTANQADALAVIQRLDPVYVDIQQSAADLLALRRALSDGKAMSSSARVSLILEDGSEYGLTGSVPFTESIVDSATGSVTLRAQFANPQGLLLPGMFVRARFAQAVNTQAFLVPQAAITRDPQGNATLYVVGANNVAVQRKVTADRAQGANWVVTSGLNPGDRVITQGTGRLKPNAKIKPVPANQPQRIVPRKDGKGGGSTGGGRP